MQKQPPAVFCKKGVLRNFAKFTGKYLSQSFFFNKVAGLRPIKKESLAQVFSCEFCEISKNTFFYRTLPVVACVKYYDVLRFRRLMQILMYGPRKIKINKTKAINRSGVIETKFNLEPKG